MSDTGVLTARAKQFVMSSEDEKTGDRVEILLVEPNPGETRLFAEKFEDAKLVNRLHTVSDGECD